MSNNALDSAAHQVWLVKGLTCLMFLMFAMTSDAVGSVIPQIIAEFKLSLTAAGAFHYAPMAAIALGALLLGFLADKLGRKATIIMGLMIYGLSSLLFAFGNSFLFFVALLFVAGVGISVFKVGALGLIGDVSRSTREHTAMMNLVEGFFAVGAIIGPAIVATLQTRGLSWKYLYVIAAMMCGVLVILALQVRYPAPQQSKQEQIDLQRTLRMVTNPYALGFSVLVMLYVAVEVAIYVWMPTYLQEYTGPAQSWVPYALTAFFVLRATGRFVGIWLLARLSWHTVLLVFALGIVVCFVGSLLGGVQWGIYLLPLSGLFMSVMYPTLNSKGISCFAKDQHGAVAGVILFFTALAAAVGPLAMAAVSDAWGGARYGFVLAAVFAVLLLLGLMINRVFDPAGRRLAQMDQIIATQ